MGVRHRRSGPVGWGGDLPFHHKNTGSCHPWYRRGAQSSTHHGGKVVEFWNASPLCRRECDSATRTNSHVPDPEREKACSRGRAVCGRQFRRQPVRRVPYALSSPGPPSDDERFSRDCLAGRSCESPPVKESSNIIMVGRSGRSAFAGCPEPDSAMNYRQVGKFRRVPS
jgi:hypothetical protein